MWAGAGSGGGGGGVMEGGSEGRRKIKENKNLVEGERYEKECQEEDEVE